MASIDSSDMETAIESIDKKPCPIKGFDKIEDFTKAGFGEIVTATKSANSFPQGSARDLYCTYPAFCRIINEESNRVLGIISKVLKWQNVKGNIQRRQPDEQFEMLLECNDTILERIGSNLDELAGVKKSTKTIIVESQFTTTPKNAEIGKGAGSWNLKQSDGTKAVARLITAKNIARPQTNFSVPVDNSASSPFVPRLKEKPNSIKPLAILPEYDDDGIVASYLHPYEFELMKFEVPADQLQPKVAQTPKALNTTEIEYIDTVPKLKTALEELKTQKMLAIDVEHHSYRSFLGLTCLVQISSEEKDYIFDALELREEMHILNLVFTDPKIVKIFHGADSDVEWLQRDLSIYIVNMFDTHQAAKSLNFARLSLAYVLKHYCNLELNKSFQLADWRMRPLPDELLEYARSDTHFLIYAYQRMTNDLLEAGNQSSKVLSSVYQRCTELCKKRYQKPLVTATTHLELCRRAKRVFDNRQLFALEHIFQWRDDIARSEDESTGYILPNHMMLQIAESLPREMQGILACCNPIPPLVRQNLHTIHQIILHARQQPLVKPILENLEIFRDSRNDRKTYNEKLHCTLDAAHDEEFRDDLPTLLRFENEQTIVQPETITLTPPNSPKLSFFKRTSTRNFERPDSQILRMPYQRFLAYLPFAEQEKREEAARLEAVAKQRRLCPAAPDLMNVKNENDTKSESKNNKDEDLYSLPIREMLKRKHDEAIAKKTAAKNQDSPNPKRFKSDAASQKTSNIAVDLTATSDEDISAEVPVAKSSAQQTNSGKQKFKHNNRYKRQKTNQTSNQAIHVNSSNSTHITPTTSSTTKQNFDYMNVDFRKFKGGAKFAKGTELKTQIHGKNNSSNKAKNKKFNKLFTFSNVKGSKK